MSSFEDVRRGVCRVVTRTGQLRGTAFFVLPDGLALTCHHVVFGLPELRLQLPGESEPRPAEYLADRSNPDADIAVLQVKGGSPPLQLARIRAAKLAYGYGFRPDSINAEPEGHTFAGRLGPGQTLRLSPSSEMINTLRAIKDGANKPWNKLPLEFRIAGVCNFDLVQGVQQGISGGPVYDPELRRITGIFRAVEGENLAYVLPLDVVFDTTWPDLEDANRREVRDSELDRLAAHFDVMPVAEGGVKPLNPYVEYHLQEVFRDYAIFGGRKAELQKLLDFVNSEERGYFFVTGPMGFGKTALMVALTRALDELSPVVHFLSRNLSAWLDLDSCLRNLCLQLMKIHRLGGRFPEREHLQRALFSELLKLTPPPGQRVAMILDGLDEAIGRWDPDANLFPPDLPPGVKVVFSAGEVADRDWLKHLRLDVASKNVLTLGKLDESDISDILAKSDIITPDPALTTARLRDLSEGDAFYLNDLLQDLKEVGGNLKSLANHPRGASKSLETWWNQAGKEVGHEGFYDLMATLAVAVAPLGREELIGVSAKDSLRGKDIGDMIGRAGRHVAGNRDDGYQLKNARIRQFVVETMRDEIGAYRDALASFCLDWNGAGRTEREMRYALANGARQLIEGDRANDLEGLLSAEYIAAKWEHFLSFRGYMKDLSLSAEALYRKDHGNTPKAIGITVARQTVRDVMSQLPKEVFAAWIRLHEVPRAITVAQDLPDARGASINQVMTMAAELLKAEYADQTIEGETFAEIGMRFLQRAFVMFPTIRMPIMRFEALERFVEITATGFSLKALQKVQFAEQLVNWGESIWDPVERSFVLGLAAHLYAIGEDREGALKALERAERASLKISLASDRLMAFAFRLQAIQHLFPGELNERIPRFDAVTDPLTTFPLAHGSGFHVLARGLGEIGLDSLPMLRDLWARAIDNIEENRPGKAHDVSHVLNAFLRIGAIEDALALIGAVKNRSQPALGPLLEGIEHLEALRAYDSTDWWACAHQGAKPHVLVRMREWTTAIQRLAVIEPRERTNALCTVFTVIDAEIGLENVPPGIWDDMIRLIADIPQAMGRASAFAAAALVSARNSERARAYLDNAIYAVVAQEPQGDTDKLQSLYAVALHQENRHTEASHVAENLGQSDVSARTYIELIKLTAPENQTALTLYSQGLLNSLKGSEGGKKTSEVLDAVAREALDLVRTHPTLGKTLCEHIAGDSSMSLTIAVEEAVARSYFDPRGGFRHLEKILETLERQSPRDHLSQLVTLLEGLSRLKVLERNDVLSVVRRVENIVQEIDVPNFWRIRLKIAKAKVLMPHAPDEAMILIREQLGVIGQVRHKSPAEVAALMFIMQTGLHKRGLAGHKLDEANDALELWRTTLSGLHDRPKESVSLLSDILDFIKTLESPADEASALVGIFESVERVSLTQRELIGSCLDKAVEQASVIERDDYQVRALQAAVRMFIIIADLSRATTAAGHIRTHNPTQRMEMMIQIARERKSPLSSVEQHLLALLPDQDHALFTAYYIPAEKDTFPYINFVMKDILQEKGKLAKVLNRSGLLDFVLAFACSLYRTGGAQMIGRVAEVIQDFDGRFAKAGRKIVSA